MGWVIKPAPPATKRVVLGLDWVTYGRHAPFYIAKEKGYYDNVGLAVDIVRGYGSTDAVAKVDIGTVDFAFGDLGSLAMARAGGSKVKMVAMIYSKAPFTIYSLPEAGINEPKDLEGKSIAAMSTGDVNYVLFVPFAELNDIDAGLVEWVFMSPPLKVPALLQGTVDSITEFIMTTPEFTGIRPDVKIMMLADYGLDIYSNGLLARESTINTDPDLVRKFVQATLKGYRYGLEHPDEAVDILLKYQPQLDRNKARAEVDIVKDIVLVPDVLELGMGWMSENKVRFTRDIYFESYDITEEVPVGDLYTLEFLSGE